MNTPPKGQRDLPVPGDTEIELKFQVPPSSRAALLSELDRGRLPVQRITLAARYLDTPDRRLARKGLAWRLRREGRRWVQTLKAAGAGPLHRFEHEVPLSGPIHDAKLHAGSPVGDQLLHLLEQARVDGSQAGVRFETQVRRISRCLRTRGAVVEVSFDEGRLIAGDHSQRIREVEFELVSGSPPAMLALAERWRHKFGLVYDPRSKAERGDRMAEGWPHPPVRKARAPGYARDATVVQAFGAVVDECLAMIASNALGLTDGDPEQRVEHVHQLRIGIRRLRSALRCFQRWVPPPPADLVERLRGVFAALGQAREADVLGTGVVAELARAGAPPLVVPAGRAGPDPAAEVRAGDTQQLLLSWICWRASPDEELPLNEGPKAFRLAAQKRLRRWHQRLADDCARFEQLDETALHTLRKRIKRQRYAVEFLGPALRAKDRKPYLDALAIIQDRMGELNDLFVARAQYQAQVEHEPGAWFALGWLAARAQQVRSLARPELEQAMKVRPPRARG